MISGRLQEDIRKTSGRLQVDFRRLRALREHEASIQRELKEESERKRAIRLHHTVGA